MNSPNPPKIDNRYLKRGDQSHDEKNQIATTKPVTGFLPTIPVDLLRRSRRGLTRRRFLCPLGTFPPPMRRRMVSAVRAMRCPKCNGLLQHRHYAGDHLKVCIICAWDNIPRRYPTPEELVRSTGRLITISQKCEERGN